MTDPTPPATEKDALKPISDERLLPTAEQLARSRELGRFLYVESVTTHTQVTRWDRLPPRARAYWTALAADHLVKGEAK